MIPTMKDKYDRTVVPALKSEHGYANPMQVPRITKVVINMSVNTKVDKDMLKAVADDLARISGQRPVITKAKNSISNFGLREGMSIGAKVTLRGVRMYEFLDRLINVALPRIRDFRGVSAKAFDGRGSYTLGLKEQTIFPEINPDNVKRSQGMDISIVTTAETDAEARALLKHLGMPFAA
jgi:large subunit ribosomal protein L5